GRKRYLADTRPALPVVEPRHAMLAFHAAAVVQHGGERHTVRRRRWPDMARHVAELAEDEDGGVDVAVMGEMRAGEDEIADAAVAEIEIRPDGRPEGAQVIEDRTAKARLHALQ